MFYLTGWVQIIPILIQNEYKLHFFIAVIKLYTIFGVQLLTIKTFTHENISSNLRLLRSTTAGGQTKYKPTAFDYSDFNYIFKQRAVTGN